MYVIIIHWIIQKISTDYRTMQPLSKNALLRILHNILCPKWFRSHTLLDVVSHSVAFGSEKSLYPSPTRNGNLRWCSWRALGALDNVTGVTIAFLRLTSCDVSLHVKRNLWKSSTSDQQMKEILRMIITEWVIPNIQGRADQPLRVDYSVRAFRWPIRQPNTNPIMNSAQ